MKDEERRSRWRREGKEKANKDGAKKQNSSRSSRRWRRKCRRKIRSRRRWRRKRRGRRRISKVSVEAQYHPSRTQFLNSLFPDSNRRSSKLSHIRTHVRTKTNRNTNTSTHARKSIYLDLHDSLVYSAFSVSTSPILSCPLTIRLFVSACLFTRVPKYACVSVSDGGIPYSYPVHSIGKRK